MLKGTQTLLAANLIHYADVDLEPIPFTAALWKPGDWVGYVTYPDSLGIVVSPEMIDGKWVKVLWCEKTGDFMMSPGRIGRVRVDLTL